MQNSFQDSLKNRIQIRKELQQVLTPGRMEHVLGVEYTSALLADSVGISGEQAALAGLLHDCAKQYSDEELLAYAKEKKVEISESEWAMPQLLHAKCGAVLAREKYGVTDSEILDAIRTHTTGCPDMTRLQQIVYVADYLEPNRMHVAELPELRRMAFREFDECFFRIVTMTLHYLTQSHSIIDPLTEATYLYYKERRE
ncbi:MAG: bis(5'-nucleosyl)-tetraphosphatase (symmetrical) YqeK [Lachnospiraceae bacterium]